MDTQTTEATGLTHKQRLLYTLAGALFVVSSIYLFGPLNIYAGNLRDLHYPITNLLSAFLLEALIITVVLTIPGLLLKGNLFKYYICGLGALGLMLWVQGNILLWKYELAGIGAGINWAAHATKGWLEVVIWFAVFAAGIFFAKRFYDKIPFLALVFFGLQTGLLATTFFGGKTIWDHGRIEETQPSEDLFKFSKKLNVIHLILDEFQSDVFKQIVDEDPELKAAFGGFTFFENALGSFPTTYPSIPAILSGNVYKNEKPVEDFVKDSYKSDHINNKLHDIGYDVDSVTPQTWIGKYGRFRSNFQIPTLHGDGVNYSELMDANAKHFFELIKFRFSPHFLKQYFAKKSDGKKDRESRLVARHFSHRAMFENITDKARVEGDKPVYKWIHLLTSHSPMVYDAKCNYAGSKPYFRKHIINNSRCVLKSVVPFLKKLKELAVFDSSMIVVNADHGSRIFAGAEEFNNVKNWEKANLGISIDKKQFHQILQGSLPLLMVKPPKGKGPLKFSQAPVSLTDIPQTIAGTLDVDLGYGGVNALKLPENAKRTRYYQFYSLFYPNARYFDQLQQFAVNGDVFDATNWRFVRDFFPANKSFDHPEVWLSSYDHKHYLRLGWYNPRGSKKWHFKEKRGVRMVEQKASLYIELGPQKTSLSVELKNPGKGPRTAAVTVDGKKAGEMTIDAKTNWHKKTIQLPGDGNRPDVSVLEFEMNKPKHNVWVRKLEIL